MSRTPSGTLIKAVLYFAVHCTPVSASVWTVNWWDKGRSYSQWWKVATLSPCLKNNPTGKPGRQQGNQTTERAI